MKGKTFLLAGGLIVIAAGAANANEHGTFVDNSDYRSYSRTEIKDGKYSEKTMVDTVTTDNWNYGVASYSQKIYVDGDLVSPTGIEVDGQVGTTAIVDPRTPSPTPQPMPPTAPPVGDPIVHANEYTQHFSESLLVGRNWGSSTEVVWFSSEVKDAEYNSLRTFSETGHRSESGKFIR